MSCSEWKEYRLEEACNISTGFAFKSKEYLDNGKYKVVRGDNVKTGFIYWEEKSRYWNDLTDRLSKYILQEKDIVIGMDGSRVGKNRAIISENDLPAILAQRVACVRAKADFSQDYIRYVIMSNTFEYYVDSIKTGTSIPHISMKQIGEFKFKAPSLEIQEKIANVLSSLDDKIELNNEMNKTLEEMAQSIFKRWFADFEFPNEDGQPYKSSGGEIVESELGMIPKGWQVTQIDDISQVTMGVSPSSKTYNEDNIGLPLLNGAADFEGKLIKPSKFTSEPKKICKKGDMVFGVRATIGNIVFADKEYALGRGVASVEPNDKVFREFIYYSLDNSMANLINNASGSVFLNLKKADITDLKVCYSEEIVEKFNNVAKVLIDKIIENDIESEMLKQNRDILLSKLMNGEIQI